MYVISPIFLYAYFKNKKLGVILIDLCLMASLLAAGIVEYTNNFSAYVPSVRPISSRRVYGATF